MLVIIPPPPQMMMMMMMKSRHLSVLQAAVLVIPCPSTNVHMRWKEAANSASSGKNPMRWRCLRSTGHRDLCWMEYIQSLFFETLKFSVGEEQKRIFLWTVRKQELCLSTTQTSSKHNMRQYTIVRMSNSFFKVLTENRRIKPDGRQKCSS